MKAMVYNRYGSPSNVLHLTEVAKPTPVDNEVLIKVYATSVNSAQLHLIRADPFLVRMSTGMLKPTKTIPGADVAGRVEAVGKDVKRFKPGDEVFGDLSSCGWGAYAEYVCADEGALMLKPANMTFAQAAAVPLAAVTALQGLRKGQIKAGQKVLVVGASGGVGSYAVQIAKALGAEVTGVASTKKLDMLRTLGADHVVDYSQEDVTRSGQQFDLIFDAAAFRPFSAYQRILSPMGIYVFAGGSTSGMFRTMLFGSMRSKSDGQQFVTLRAGPNLTDLEFVKDLLEAGKVIPFIDRCVPLSEAAAALTYVEDRQVRGKVVISIAQDRDN
ncbi:MAG: NAD(P)-dependent alcohol dehydrogenase [Chloroflexi bacterium]|nr:NAD(P)-dependent alcohol dehydrogenase [Chloroflexota bacterium]